MMTTHRERQVLHGTALIDGKLYPGVTVSVEDGRIVAVQSGGAGQTARIIAPGFIDVHVHGAAGADFMDGTEEAARRVCAAHARTGTTALMATTLTASRGAIDRAIDAARAVAERPAAGEAQIVGLHLEGPYLNAARAGAQDASCIRPPDVRELGAWLDRAGPLPLIATVAPEIPGVLDLIEEFRRRMSFSIGHTCATYEVARAALDAGARHFTHLFNAMTPLHHREPGVVGAALHDEEATAELIADGHHVHPAVLAMAARAMVDRAALVTDAMRACGMPDGTYKLHDFDVTVADGTARLADGTLAGSVLTMAGAVKVAVERARLPLAAALQMASAVPARIVGVDDRKGRIKEGFDADIVVLEEDLSVHRVFVGGEEVEI